MIVEDLEFSQEINKDKFIKINGCGSWEFESTIITDFSTVVDFDPDFDPDMVDIKPDFEFSPGNSMYSPNSFYFELFAYTEEPGEYSVITTSISPLK